MHGHHCVLLWLTMLVLLESAGPLGLALAQRADAPQESVAASANLATTTSTNTPLTVVVNGGAVVVSVLDGSVELTSSQSGKLLTLVDAKTRQRWMLDTAEFALLQGTNRLELSGEMLVFRRDGTPLAEVRRGAAALAAAGAIATGIAPVVPGPAAARGVISGAVSPSGKLAVLACSDRTLRFFEIATGREVRQYRWSPQGSRSTVEMAAGKDQRAFGAELGVLRDASDRVQAVRFSEDGRELLVASTRFVNILDSASARRLSASVLNLGSIRAAAFSVDGRTLVTDGSRELRVWDVASGRLIRTLPHHMDVVHDVGISSNARRAFCAGGYFGNSDTPLAELARVWDLENGKVLFELQSRARTSMHGAISPDGQTVAAPDLDKGESLALWKTQTGQKTRSLRVANSVQHVSFSPDGERVASLAADGKLQVFSVSDGQQIAEDSERPGQALFVAWLPDSSALVVSDGNNLRQLALPAATPPPVPRPSMTAPASEELRRTTFDWNDVGMVFTSDGQRALVGQRGVTLRLWDIANARELKRFRGDKPAHHIRCLALSPDNRLALIGGGGGIGSQRLSLWNIESWSLVRVFEGLESLPNCVAFSPDGRHALCGSLEGDVRVWEVESGRQLASFRPPVRGVRAVAVSANGTMGASAGGESDHRVRLWDLATGSELRLLTGHTQHVTFVAFLPGGNSIVTASDDRTIRQWDVADGRELRRISEPARILCAALAPDGKRYVVGGDDGTVAVWSLETGQELVRHARHTGPVTSIAITADQQHVVSASTDRTIRTWRLPQVTPGLTPPASLPSLPRVTTVAREPGPTSEPATLNLQRLPDGQVFAAAASQPLDEDQVAELMKHPKLQSLTISNLRATHNELGPISGLKSLRSLAVTGRFSPAVIRQIGALDQLQSIHLSGSPLTNQTLAELKSLARLQDLTISGSRVTDEGLAHLRALPLLRRIFLTSSLVTGSGLDHLQTLPELEEIVVISSPLTDEGLASVTKLPNLLRLRLTGCYGVGDEGLRSIGKLAKLKHLELVGTNITDAGLAHLQGLSNLQFLTIVQARITDAGLPHLASLTELRVLDLGHLNASPEAVARLVERLPKLQRPGRLEGPK